MSLRKDHRIESLSPHLKKENPQQFIRDQSSPRFANRAHSRRISRPQKPQDLHQDVDRELIERSQRRDFRREVRRDREPGGRRARTVQDRSPHFLQDERHGRSRIKVGFFRGNELRFFRGNELRGQILK